VRETKEEMSFALGAKIAMNSVDANAVTTFPSKSGKAAVTNAKSDASAIAHANATAQTTTNGYGSRNRPIQIRGVKLPRHSSQLLI
jgi:hypothetical protein